MPTIRTSFVCNRLAATVNMCNSTSDGSESSPINSEMALMASSNVNADGGDEVASKVKPSTTPVKLEISSYNIKDLLEMWRKLPRDFVLSDWCCYVKTAKRRKDWSQVDEFVAEFCTKKLGMRLLSLYGLNSGSSCLMWLGRTESQQYLDNMRKGAHIIGRLPCDVLLKHKQCFGTLLSDHRYVERPQFDKQHGRCRSSCQCKCSDPGGADNQLCWHQYFEHGLKKCEVANCSFDPCECMDENYFIPEECRFSHKYQMMEFLKRYETDDQYSRTLWLAKPTYLTGGKGFFLIRNADEFRQFYLVRSDSCLRRDGFVLQRYLRRTKVVNKRKIDFRMFLIIIVLNARRVCGFFCPGYSRSAVAEYKAEKNECSSNIFEHLTSAELAELFRKADSEMVEDSLAFNSVVPELFGNKEDKDNDEDAQSNKFTAPKYTKDDNNCEFFGIINGKPECRLHACMKQMVQSICKKMEPLVHDKPGAFQVFGLDILIDADGKPWLLEINPHIAKENIYSKEQANLIADVIAESICLVCEMLQKSLQEESMSTEVEVIEQRLLMLTEAQRHLTAKDELEKLVRLKKELEIATISLEQPPIFLQNFYWWYDTPESQRLKLWLLRGKRDDDKVRGAMAKKMKKREPRVEWYSRMFATMRSRRRDEMKGDRKATLETRKLDDMDLYRQAFRPAPLQLSMEEFTKRLETRAAKIGEGVTDAMDELKERIKEQKEEFASKRPSA